MDPRMEMAAYNQQMQYYMPQQQQYQNMYLGQYGYMPQVMQVPEMRREIPQHYQSPYQRVDFRDLILKVFTYLSTSDLCVARCVCALWSEIGLEPGLWRSISVRFINGMPRPNLRNHVVELSTELRATTPDYLESRWWPSLTRLTLSVPLEHLEHMPLITQHCTGLTGMHLIGPVCESRVLTSKPTVGFWPTLRNIEGLNYLRLDDFYLDQPAIHDLTTCNNLITLDCSESAGDIRAVQLEEFASNCQNLENLLLHGNMNAGTSSYELESGLNALFSLQHLRCVSIVFEAACSPGSPFPFSVDLSRAHALRTLQLVRLGLVVPHTINKLPINLERLIIWPIAHIKEDALCQLVARCPNIRQLHAGYTQATRIGERFPQHPITFL